MLLEVDGWLQGTLVRRYKRFLADILLDDGREITAHCPNSGSMLAMRQPGSEVLVSPQDKPGRKLKWTWEMVRPSTTSAWIGCNTSRPNELVAAAIGAGQLPGLDANSSLRREVPYGTNSRIDIMAGDVYVEVKNTTLAAPNEFIEALPSDAKRSDLDVLDDMPLGSKNTALFPDAVTARGAKHMDELRCVVEQGGDAMVVFVVNRGDCQQFKVAHMIDPTYVDAWNGARDAGVKMVPLRLDLSPQGWSNPKVLPAS